MQINKELKIKGNKLICIEATIKQNLIQSIKISGDFFLYPEEAIVTLEQALQNMPYQKSELEKKLNQLIKINKWLLVGIDVQSILAALF